MSALLAFISVPAWPVWSGSAVMPIAASMRRSTASSISAPPRASRRAGPASSTGAPIMPSPPEAAQAEPTKTNGRWRWLSCQVGVAVSESSTAV